MINEKSREINGTQQTIKETVEYGNLSNNFKAKVLPPTPRPRPPASSRKGRGNYCDYACIIIMLVYVYIWSFPKIRGLCTPCAGNRFAAPFHAHGHKAWCAQWCAQGAHKVRTMVRTRVRTRCAQGMVHTMVRASDLDQSLDFYCDKLGLVEIDRFVSEAGRFTLVFLAAPEDAANAEKEQSPCVEITWYWDPESYEGGRNFGHLAYEVEDIYEICQRMMDAGVTINRPPRDGHMAFVRSPAQISIELIQKGTGLAPQDPWASMENTGAW